MVKKNPGKNKITSPRLNLSPNNSVLTGLLDQCIKVSSIGYVITDCGQKNNPVVFVNKVFREITGYETKEVIGRNCRFLFS